MPDVEGYDLGGFGDRVYTRRKELGLTQAQLAKQTGVDETAVRRWEDNILPRDAVVLVLLAVALRRSVGWVLGEAHDAAFIDGIRLALDHVARIAREDLHRLDFQTADMLIEMKTGYAPAPRPAVQRVAEAPAVPMDSTTPPAPVKGSKRAADRAG